MKFGLYRHANEECVRDYIVKNALYPTGDFEHIARNFMSPDQLKALRVLARMREIANEEGMSFIAFLEAQNGARYCVTNVEPWG